MPGAMWCARGPLMREVSKEPLLDSGKSVNQMLK